MAIVRVIGCGNPDAGDDAAGLLAVRRARPLLKGISQIEVVEARSGVGVLDLLDGADAVIVVDAVRSRPSGRPPGDLVMAEAGPDGLPAELHGSISSHGFGVAESVGLATALGKVGRLAFIGVEAGEVAVGRPPSPPVAEALPEMARRIVAEARRLLAEVSR